MEVDYSNVVIQFEEGNSDIVDVENDEPQSNEDVSLYEQSIEEISSAQVSSPTSKSLDKENVPNKETVTPKKQRLARLPLARVRNIMKMDPDCNIVKADAVFLVTKATELFLQYVAKESVKYTHIAKRKTVLRRDTDAAIDKIDNLCFLEGALE